MPEYIDRETAIKHIETHTPYRCPEDFIEGQRDCVEQLKTLPAADVVEVVRCMDCQGLNRAVVRPEGRYLCERRNQWVWDEDFCSYGKKKKA